MPFYLQHQSIDDEVSGLKMIQLREPVPTLFNTKNADDIFMDLAERLGILYGEGGLYDHLNQGLDWVDKEDGLNMNGEWKAGSQPEVHAGGDLRPSDTGLALRRREGVRAERERVYRILEAEEGVLPLLLFSGQSDPPPFVSYGAEGSG